MNNGQNKIYLRIYIFAWFIFGIGLLFWGRMFWIQIVKADYFQEKVTEQRVKEIKQIPERGKIEDRTGQVLAMSLMAQDIAVYPNLIQNEKHQQRVAKLLSETLYEKDSKLSKEQNEEKQQAYYENILKIVKTNKPWVSIAKRVDPDITAVIKKADLGGIEIKQSPKRYYPNGDLAGSVLGFVNDLSVPGAGVEISMDSYLAGVPGYKIAETDNMGNVIPIGFENNTPPRDGQNVRLTIDSHIQYILEKRLKKAMKEISPKSIHAVVMNPKTGEILAMASYPSFNPGKYRESDPKTWTNSPASFVYEPGSTFKPVYMAMALQSKAIDENFSRFDGKGYINVQGSNIKNWDGRALGQYGLRDIIINSSNVGMIEISKTLTNEQIVAGLKKAGFGQRTGVEMPGEETGLFPNANKDKSDFNSLYNDPIRKATISFGQGISITPVQLITAFSSVVNGGKRVNAHIVDNVKDSEGNLLYTGQKETNEQIYSKKTSDNMKSYLESNMLEGSGKDYQLDGYRSGGKTGSAWVVENGGYKRGVIIGSFMGFAPLEDPEVAMLVVVDQPKGIEFGGPSAGPIYHDVMTDILRYKSVPTKNAKKSVSYTVPNTKGLLYEDAKQYLEDEMDHATVKNSGEGEVVDNQVYRSKNGDFSITLQTKKIVEGKELTVPYLIGKSKSDIKKLFKPYHVNVQFHGTGDVSEQSLKPGTYSYTKNKTITLWLQ